MAAAQAAVANKGTYCSPVAIDRVYSRVEKKELTVPKSICSQAVTPEVAAGMTYAMQRVISGGTGGASSTGDGTSLAGKTGTTDSGVHTWMTGFSTAVGTATWVGNVVGSKSLSSFRLNNKAANTVRHDIWRTIMKTANKLYPGGSFDAPPASMLSASMAIVPIVAGQDPQAAVQVLKAAGFSPAIATTQVTGSTPAGTVAYTRPSANSSAATGSQIRIYVSKGGSVTVPNVSGMTVANAKATLLAAGYAAVSEPQASQTQYFQKSATIAKGNVIGTDPASGTAASVNSAILLIISTGP
jgi:membrane peptidoglycan carboxypeptidase